MKLNPLWIAVCALILFAGPDAATSQMERPAPQIRIGVYQGRAVALAYWRSEMGMGQIRDTVDKARAAKQNGCTVMQQKELDADCRTLQDHMMAQAFGGAPIDDVLNKLQDVLPRVAEKNDLVAIVPDVTFKSDAVQTVDVTDDLAATFKPSAQTHQMMCDLSKQPAAPLKVSEGN